MNMQTPIVPAIDRSFSAPRDLLIGGAWRTSDGDRRFPVFNPVDESVLVEIADASEADALRAVDAAEAAQPAWGATAPRHRGEILRRAFERMIADRERLARLITLENGKSLRDALAEVDYAAEFFRWFSEEAVRASGQTLRAPSGAADILVWLQPVGVCLFITPWNFPAAMATRKIGPALAAGCACVLKPAAETPLTALAIAEILLEAGAPPGVVNVVTTRRSGPVVSAMLNHRAVRKLSFTGSTQIGRLLLAQAAERIVNCSMELGGDAPLLVFDDADLDLAVDGAMIAKMRNGGQACTAANRLYVQKGVFATFAEKFAAKMAALRMGDGLAPGVDLGPLVNKKAQSAMRAFVDLATARGGEIIVGGAAPPGAGCFFPATVLTQGDRRELVDDEVFGPIAPIMRFDDADEAIARANAVDYGLVAYVFTRDVGKGLAVCRRLETGMVALNRGVVSDPAAPFGGVKQSGLGREGGHEGLLAFLESKYVSIPG